MRWLYPDARLLAFEPNPAVCTRLAERLGSDAKAEVFPCALAATAGRRALYATGAPALASLLEPAAGLRETFGPEYSATAVVEIETRRFDEAVDLARYPKPVLLKMDVQGAELEVLEGAAAQLGHVACVKLELSFDKYYLGQSSCADLVGLLADHGFTRSYQESMNVADRRVRWCDLVFLR